MTVKKMIEALSKLPQDAEIFVGVFYSESQNVDGLRLVELYERAPVYYPEVMGCGSSAPWKRFKHSNVVILEEP